MKKKKGFTIVELVIVIAVIAVLAAVLIPTFSSLIAKANLSSDQVAVRNMNNALAMDEAQNGKPADLMDAMIRMKKNGYEFDRYKPLSEGHRFFWNQTENKIVLVSVADKKIVYPTELNGQSIDGNSVYKPLYRELSSVDHDVVTALINGTSSKVKDSSGAVVKLSEASASKPLTVTIDDESDLAAVAAVVNGAYSEADDLEYVTVVLPASLDLSGEAWIPIGESETTPFKGTLKGESGENRCVIKGLTADGYIANIAYASQLESGQIGVSYGLVGFANKAVIENITIENVDIDLSYSAMEAGCLVGYVNNGVTIRNCTVGNEDGTSQLKGLTKVGGLVGTIKSPDEANPEFIFENCINYVNVVATDTKDTNTRAAGFIGALQANQGGATYTFTNCINYGTITAPATSQNNITIAGGFTAQLTGRSKETVFTNCKNLGTISALYTDDLVASINNGTHIIKAVDCYHKADGGVENPITDAADKQFLDYSDANNIMEITSGGTTKKYKTAKTDGKGSWVVVQ